MEIKTMTCEKCGRPLREDSIVCMHCGRAAHHLELNLNLDEISSKDKASTIVITRILCLGVLVMNLITIFLSMDDSAMRFAYMGTAAVCGFAAAVLVLWSFGLSKKENEDEVNTTSNTILKAAYVIASVSAVDFFAALQFTAFWPF